MTELLSQYKYFIFYSVCIFGIPTFYLLSRMYPFVEKVVFFLMIFFTCRMEDINFASHEFYRGTSRGFEIGLVDVVTLVIFFLVLSRRNKFKIRLIPPGSIIFGLYFLISVISIFNSAIYLYSYFEILKMVRMYLFFWVLYNYMQNNEQLNLWFRNVMLIIMYVFLTIMYQKYVLHIYQCDGPFPHRNSLVMYMMVFTCILLARILDTRDRNELLMLMVFLGMGAITILATLSRAGMMCFAFGGVITLGMSYMSKVTYRKIAISCVLGLLALGVLAKAADSIYRRIKFAPESSKTTRIVLAHAAINMANDKFFGVGLNNFGHKINAPYPYGWHIHEGDREHVGGLVETIYLMIAAETGWLNLGVFIFFLMSFYYRNFINFLRYKDNAYRFISIGLAGGMAGIFLESSLEWVLKQTNNFYQLMMIFAIIAAMGQRYFIDPRLQAGIKIDPIQQIMNPIRRIMMFVFAFIKVFFHSKR